MYKIFSTEKRVVRESSRIQNGLHAPKCIPFYKALKEISDFETLPTYLLPTFVSPGRSVERMCLLQSGLERKEQSRRRECSEHWKCIDTPLKPWPFWQLCWSCVRARYHISASASPAAQQQLLYNHWILFLHCITMAPGQRFLEGDASREREPQLWSCSVQVKWNWPGLL